MNNPFEYEPSEMCVEAFGRLLSVIDGLRDSRQPADILLCRELDAGKMLGVLVAEDNEGKRHNLYAFSGQLGNGGFQHPQFVGPVFDYLDPDGYFKRRESLISDMSREIERFECDEYNAALTQYEDAGRAINKELEGYKEEFRRSKAERAQRRAAGHVDVQELDAMTRRSQFEKAELKRIRQRLQSSLTPYAEAYHEAQRRLDSMKERRRESSEELQRWLFDNFKVMNAHGTHRSLSEIFASTPFRVPPSGAGECCAPKLLQEAYRKGWLPLAIAEYWYGAPKGGEVRVHGRHYPACRGKCGPVLRWMLQGIDVNPPLDAGAAVKRLANPVVIYENDRFCVVEKPSGMLSVPGKIDVKSVQEWLDEYYGEEKKARPVHRLDQDTSGLLVVAFGDASLKMLQRMFASRKMKKTYVAILEGDYEEKGLAKSGRISLPLSPDILDRPRQRVDVEGGKEALTDYEFIGVESLGSRIRFQPLTGRTHQLRVHSASSEGLGMPIAGDRLYGRYDKADRLLLHAHRLEFDFPAEDGDHHYVFESPVPF